jgi:GNAT superfamily N-acetyltransferase
MSYLDETGEDCAFTIAHVPDWDQLPNLGLPDMGGMTGKDAFGAYIDGEGVGLIIIRYHYGDTADICWVGVHPHRHHKGIGSALMERALSHARERQCSYAVCTFMTGHDDGLQRDSRHKLAARFGFKPFLKFNENDALHTTAVMILPLT